ncbi:MAG: threonine synthase [Deltaproteobacteria bacterium]|nr:threonine synthase [Deltaproteobacteria bacterium]
MTIYYSTNHKVPEVDLAEALLTGMAGDKGLFMPKAIPKLSADLMTRARDLSYPELASEILWPYVEGVFTREVLAEICDDAYNYDVPLEKVVDQRYVMRLDQGPTASFKDFAARFMGRAIGRLVRERGTELLILTATSGDTGSAVANAFLGVEGIRALVLFPIKEVSNRQRKQMTTLSDNVATLALPGKFDDCQALVKQAFSDPELASYNLSSANSINIGRLLPQSVYYVYSASRLADIAGGEEVIFSVPSGNFGDMMGGMLSLFNGLPIAKFIIATNANDEVPLFLETGRYEKLVPSRTCISNAMNVGHPSNLARLVDLYGGHMDELGKLHKSPDMDGMRRDIFAVSIDDNETRQTIGTAYEKHNLLLEPHGAVGWAGLERYLDLHPEDKKHVAISLETAHPAKFPEEIEAINGIDPPVPPSLEGLEEKPEHYKEIDVDYAAFKSYLQKEYGK